MITLKSAPMDPVMISAVINGSCVETASLFVTSATAAQWQTGHDRYTNDSVTFEQPCLDHIMGAPLPAGVTCPDAPPACADCHAQNGPAVYEDDPEQIGGFSDQEVIGIITQAIVPGCGTTGACTDGGYFDPYDVQYLGDAGTAYEAWRRYHQWTDVQGSTAQAMVVYLRSLTPYTGQRSDHSCAGIQGSGAGSWSSLCDR